MSYRDSKDARIAQLEAELSLLKQQTLNLNTSPVYEIIKIEKITDDLAMIFVKDYKQGQLSQVSTDSAKKIKLGSKVRWVMQLVEE